MEGYPKPVNKNCTQKILDQMNNNFIYKIKEKDGNFSNGFFCHIKYQKKNIPVVIINNHIIKDDIIKVLIDDDIKQIKIGKIKIINEENNISILEIEKNIDYNINYLELDDNIYENESELIYDKESIYIINYNNEKDISVSYGKINNINKSQLLYTGYIYLNSHGLPIFNLSNNKIIGIHDNKSKYYNKGIFFKYIELINNYNEIDIKIDIKKEDIKNKIYFLDNYKKKENQLKEEHLKELNNENTKLYINNKTYEFKQFFIPEKEGEYNIKLKFIINLNDCSYMFAGCKYIKEIKFISFNTENITNMKYMFYNCSNLKNLDLYSFNTKNVNNMSYMFYNCSCLNNLYLYSFNNKNVKNMSYMLYNCEKLKLINLDLSSFYIKEDNNISFMFYGCNNLKDIYSIFKGRNEIFILVQVGKKDINQKIYFLNNTNEHNLKELNVLNTELYINNKRYKYKKYFEPEKEGIYSIILKFNNISIKNFSYMFYRCENIINIDLSFVYYENVKDMACMFSGCRSLESLSDISKWETKNVINMSGMFSSCISLEFLPDISKWDTKNVTNMSGMFFNCSSLKTLSDISIWNTKNVKDMACMFSGCRSLKSLPDISKWDTNNVTNMSDMFSGCISLKSLPDISEWDTNNVTNMSDMFLGCLVKSLPEFNKKK